MTFEQLYKDELSLRLNQSDTSALFTAARRKQAINDAIEEFADLTECYVKQSTQTVSCNVTEYAILSNSTDYVRLAKQGVEYVHTSSNSYLTQASGDDFPRRDLGWRNRFDPHWRESTTPVLIPTGYYVREDAGDLYLGLNEPPKVGSSESAELVIPYVAKPPVLTSTGEVPFSSRGDLRIYHKALPHYAAYKLLPLVGDEQGAQAALQQFLGYVARYQQANRPKGGQHVTTGRSYFRDAQRRSVRGNADAGPGWERP